MSFPKNRIIMPLFFTKYATESRVTPTEDAKAFMHLNYPKERTVREEIAGAKKKGETWKELDKLHLFGKALRDDSTRGSRVRSRQR